MVGLANGWEMVSAEIPLILKVTSELIFLCWLMVNQDGHLLLRANVERQLTNN